MIVAARSMTLNGHPVKAGQVLDSIWPDLRELARRNLLRQRWVTDVKGDAEGFQMVRDTTAASPVVKRRGRPKGSKNHPKPVAPA
jgi:hypothetical protein